MCSVSQCSDVDVCSAGGRVCGSCTRGGGGSGGVAGRSRVRPAPLGQQDGHSGRLGDPQLQGPSHRLPDGQLLTAWGPGGRRRGTGVEKGGREGGREREREGGRGIEREGGRGEGEEKGKRGS